MEEVVGKLTAWTPKRTLLALCIGVATWGHLPCATPQGGALGHPTPKRGRGDPCGQISQLEVCQLLITGPQVIYPLGLNGCNEPIITTLLEPLASGVSLTAGEPVYLEINIPPSPVEEPDQKVSTLGEVSTIMIASPHKSTPQNQEMAAWPQRSGTSYSKQYWKHLAVGPKTQLPGGPTQWLSLCLKGTTSVSRHVISGECRGGRSIPRGNSHQHLSHHHGF